MIESSPVWSLAFCSALGGNTKFVRWSCIVYRTLTMVTVQWRLPWCPSGVLAYVCVVLVSRRKTVVNRSHRASLPVSRKRLLCVRLAPAIFWMVKGEDRVGSQDRTDWELYQHTNPLLVDRTSTRRRSPAIQEVRIRGHTSSGIKRSTIGYRPILLASRPLLLVSTPAFLPHRGRAAHTQPLPANRKVTS